MIIYIVLFVFIMIIGIFTLHPIRNGKLILGKKCSTINKNTFIIIIFLSMLLIQGLRDMSVGADTEAYYGYFYRIYRNVEKIDFQKLEFTNIEMGYVVLNLLLSKISIEPQVFIFMISAVVLFLHLYFLRVNSENILLSIILFFGCGHFFTSMVSIRQYIAIGIVMWMIPLISEKKYKQAILVGGIAFLFHNSVVIFWAAILCTYFFKQDIKHIWGLLLGLLASLPITNILLSYILRYVPKYSYYDSKNMQQ